MAAALMQVEKCVVLIKKAYFEKCSYENKQTLGTVKFPFNYVLQV